jgi:hypothetical protein
MPPVIAYHEIKDAMDVPDLDKVMEAVRTQPGADAMDHDGVLPETLVVLLEASGDPS